ncbi:MAG TPA: hypothetical protein VEV43_01165 [Actinomycetota bacterium]|nr:hypothetical protein [Actinomycetota bacterium]
MKWFGVRCVFWHDGDSFEERITLWRAESIDEAIAQAEEEARAYCEGIDCKYVGLAQGYGPAAGPGGDDAVEIVPGTEVFSLFRLSEFEPREYLDHFFDTGSEVHQDWTPGSFPS